MDILGPIVELVDLILGRVDRWRDKSAEQRKKVATYLQAVSECLAKVAHDLRTEHRAYSACVELAHYALKLPDAVQSELGEEGGKLLEQLKKASHDREALVKGVDVSDEAQRKLALMEEMAGRIKATAVLLNVS